MQNNFRERNTKLILLSNCKPVLQIFCFLFLVSESNNKTRRLIGSASAELFEGEREDKEEEEQELGDQQIRDNVLLRTDMRCVGSLSTASLFLLWVLNSVSRIARNRQLLSSLLLIQAKLELSMG